MTIKMVNEEYYLKKIKLVENETTIEKIIGMIIFYVLTPLILIYGIYKLIRRFILRKNTFFKEQRYVLYYLSVIEIASAIVGMIN